MSLRQQQYCKDRHRSDRISLLWHWLVGQKTSKFKSKARIVVLVARESQQDKRRPIVKSQHIQKHRANDGVPSASTRAIPRPGLCSPPTRPRLCSPSTWPRLCSPTASWRHGICSTSSSAESRIWPVYGVSFNGSCWNDNDSM